MVLPHMTPSFVQLRLYVFYDGVDCGRPTPQVGSLDLTVFGRLDDEVALHLQGQQLVLKTAPLPIYQLQYAYNSWRTHIDVQFEKTAIECDELADNVEANAPNIAQLLRRLADEFRAVDKILERPA